MWGKFKLRFQDWLSADPLLVADFLEPPTGEFVKGINLGGEAVTIAGNFWLSDEAARAAGLVTPQVNLLTTNIQPLPYLKSGARRMLNSGIYRRHQLELKQALPNGDYDIYLWMMENYQSDWHCFTVALAGQIVESNVGKLALGQWRRHGAYRTAITDGTLHLVITAQNPDIDAHLMGLSIFKL